MPLCVMPFDKKPLSHLPLLVWSTSSSHRVPFLIRFAIKWNSSGWRREDFILGLHQVSLRSLRIRLDELKFSMLYWKILRTRMDGLPCPMFVLQKAAGGRKAQSATYVQLRNQFDLWKHFGPNGLAAQIDGNDFHRGTGRFSWTAAFWEFWLKMCINVEQSGTLKMKEKSFWKKARWNQRNLGIEKTNPSKSKCFQMLSELDLWSEIGAQSSLRRIGGASPHCPGWNAPQYMKSKS